MTNDLGLAMNVAISPAEVFAALVKKAGVDTRFVRSSDIPRGAGGNTIFLEENMVKRAFAMKFVRTALFSQFSGLIEFTKSQSQNDIIRGEFSVGQTIKFQSTHDPTSVSFQSIQNIFFYWYLVDSKLHVREFNGHKTLLLVDNAFTYLKSLKNTHSTIRPSTHHTF